MVEIDVAERSLLGAVMLTSGTALDEIQVEAADFRNPHHATVWQIMLTMRSRGMVTDLVTVGQTAMREATERGITQSWLHSIYQETVTPANAAYYAQIVRDEATRRRIREAGTRITQMADDIPGVDDLVDGSRSELDTAAKINVSSVRSMGETIDETLEMLERPAMFIPSPWGALNHMIGGWRAGALYVVGARPGSGKSLMGLQAALTACASGAVAFSTLEMSRDEVHNRVIAQTAGVSMRALMNSELSPSDWEKIGQHRADWDRMPLFVDDRSGVSVNQVKAFARSVNRRQKLSAVVVDYLQLMEGPRGDKRNRNELIGAFTRQLKIFARELGVPVIALSQLNRAGASRQDPMPAMSDLRESGSIEQDADVIMLINRDAVERPGALDVLVAKNRQGVQGAFTLTWEGHYSRVADQRWSPTQSIKEETA